MIDQKREGYQIFDTLPGALIELDFASQKVIYMNRIAYAVFGYSPADIKSGILARDIFLDDAGYARALEIIKSFGLDSYEKQTPYSRHEKQDLYDFMFKKKGGPAFHGEVQGSFVLDQARVPTGLRMYIRDLTKQRAMEASLQASEERYRTLVEGSPDLIFLFSTEGIVMSANKAAFETLGKTLDEIVGKNISEILPPEALLPSQQYLQNVFVRGESSYTEISIPVKGQTVWFNASFNPIRDKDGKISAVLSVARDVTKHKLAKQQLESALNQVETANLIKNEFLSNMSHEVRTPLTSIIGFTDYLKKTLEDKLGPKDRESFDYIYQNSNRLLKIVNSLLNFSQMQSGRFELNPKIIYLNSYCEKLCDKLRPEADKKGLNLAFTSKTTADKIWLDEYSIRQALENIVLNGIKYTEEGEIRVTLNLVRKQLVLSISDTGIGMSPEYLEQVFQPFNQESNGFTREYQGVGLGLALSKRFLEWNEVDIEVESKKGKGSTFKLTFPKSDS